MTTKRYYYTDALTAAWAAKHLGLRYQTWLRGSVNYDWLNPNSYISMLGEWVDGCNLYVQESCTPIIDKLMNPSEELHFMLKHLDLLPKCEAVDQTN